MNNTQLCGAAVLRGNWDTRPICLPFVDEAKRRGLNCGVTTNTTTISAATDYRIHQRERDYDICYMIAENADPDGIYLAEAKVRGLTCSGRVSLSEAKVTEQIAKAMKLKTSVNVCLRALEVSKGWKNSVWSNKDRTASFVRVVII